MILSVTVLIDSKVLTAQPDGMTILLLRPENDGDAAEMIEQERCICAVKVRIKRGERASALVLYVGNLQVVLAQGFLENRTRIMQHGQNFWQLALCLENVRNVALHMNHLLANITL